MDLTPEQFQEFFDKIVGKMPMRPTPGLNNAQLYADEQGIPYDEAKARMKAWRSHAGERHQMLDLLNSLGFGFDEFGFKDKHEEGKSAYDTDRLSGKMGFRANGWEYNWQTGMKRNVITSDQTARDRWIPIEPGELERHQRAQRLGDMGFKTYSQQLAYRRAKQAGQEVDSWDDIKRDELQLTPEEIQRLLGFGGNDGLDASSITGPMGIGDLMTLLGIKGVDTSGRNLITHVGGVKVPPQAATLKGDPGVPVGATAEGNTGFNGSGTGTPGRFNRDLGFGSGPRYDPGANSFARGPKGKGTVYKLGADSYGKQDTSMQPKTNGNAGFGGWGATRAVRGEEVQTERATPTYQQQPRRRPRPGFGSSANPLSGSPAMGFGAGPKY